MKITVFTCNFIKKYSIVIAIGNKESRCCVLPSTLIDNQELGGGAIW